MTIVIKIAPNSTAESVRRLLPQVRNDDHIALELPEGWAELDNMARVRLLQRQAQLLQIDVALIANHEATVKAAKQVGIPVFARPDQAVRTSWQMKPLLPLIDPRQPDAGLPEAPPWQNEKIIERMTRQRTRRARQHRIQVERRYRQIAPLWLRWVGYGLMGALMVLLLMGFTLFVLPAATVTIVPGREPISASVRLTVDPALDAPDLDQNLIPARLVEVNIEERGLIATSGSRQKATDQAVGQVTFTNLTNAAVRVPAGTEVSTSTGTPIGFVTTAAVEVPPRGTVNAPIEAEEPGALGNVLPNTISRVGGAARFRVRVTNRAGTFGGGAQLVSVVTQEDRDRLRAETEARAQASAYDSLSQRLEEGEWLPPASVETFVQAQAFSGFNDEEANELQLTLNVLARGAAVEDVLTTEAALAALQNAVPNDAQIVSDSIQFQREPGSVSVGSAVQFTMTATADYVIPVDPAEVREIIAGLTPEQAIDALLARWNLVRAPEIYRDPEVLPTLPTLYRRIQVRIEYEE